MRTLMNFSWLIEGEVAGSSRPRSRQELVFLEHHGVKALVRMADDAEAYGFHAEVEDSRLADCHEPVKDFTAPSQEQAQRMVAFVREHVSRGQPVCVSCGSGLGRTGTVLACYLVSKGSSAEEAIRRVRHVRPGSIETPEQEQAVHDYAMWLRTGRG